MLKSPTSAKDAKFDGLTACKTVLKLSKNETGDDGGRYNREMQCLEELVGRVKDIARNSRLLEGNGIALAAIET